MQSSMMIRVYHVVTAPAAAAAAWVTSGVLFFTFELEIISGRSDEQSGGGRSILAFVLLNMASRA